MQHFGDLNSWQNNRHRAKALDCGSPDRDKCCHENADHEHLYLCDHYWLAACWPGRFRLPFLKQDDNAPARWLRSVVH